ncbi:hypothetical protein SLEP1_g58085 [Rubroshorea leprosula]|uniref:Uncharacterized protein n=1 Tax=Rubroshorea leprosula TaxID=152421 RepID=A0AAV5MN47_9ROSI|nr:hypothetical protein SLEP1_g58085 [Rubroshorea leprosula]
MRKKRKPLDKAKDFSCQCIVSCLSITASFPIIENHILSKREFKDEQTCAGHLHDICFGWYHLH